jgi:hypothetical protein
LTWIPSHNTKLIVMAALFDSLGCIQTSSSIFHPLSLISPPKHTSYVFMDFLINKIHCKAKSFKMVLCHSKAAFFYSYIHRQRLILELGFVLSVLRLVCWACLRKHLGFQYFC